MNEQNTEAKDLEWKRFFRLGGISALIVTAFFLIDMVILMALSPYPATASGWFELLQKNRPVGLLSLDIFVLAGFPLCYPLFFALYGVLKQTSHVYLAFATVLAFTGLAIVIATDKTYALISLSNQYATAATEGQRSLLLTAGETVLAASSGTGPNVASLFLKVLL